MKIIIFKPKAFFALLAMTGVLPGVVFTLWGLLDKGVLSGIAIGAIAFAAFFLLSGIMNSRGHYWRISGYSEKNVVFLLLITFMLLGAGGILIATTVASVLNGLINSGLLLEFIAGWTCLIGTIIFWRISKDWEIKKR